AALGECHKRVHARLTTRYARAPIEWPRWLLASRASAAAHLWRDRPCARRRGWANLQQSDPPRMGFALRTRLTTAALVSTLALLPTAAVGHPGLGHAHGFVHGFAHPFGGLDHMLAMVAVGLLAWQLGGRALVLVPATFVLVMAAAAALAVAGVPVPG